MTPNALALIPEPAPAAPPELGTIFDMVVNGGPVRVPIALCSVVALAYSGERWLRLRSGPLGSTRIGREIVAAVAADGPARGLHLCSQRPSPLTRILLSDA